MNKKAQGLSLNVIIVAVIALLVLVVLAVIFSGRLGIFAQKTGECATIGGSCVSEGECIGDFQRVDNSYSCPEADASQGPVQTNVCCISVTS